MSQQEDQPEEFRGQTAGLASLAQPTVRALGPTVSEVEKKQCHEALPISGCRAQRVVTISTSITRGTMGPRKSTILVVRNALVLY